MVQYKFCSGEDGFQGSNPVRQFLANQATSKVSSVLNRYVLLKTPAVSLTLIPGTSHR